MADTGEKIYLAKEDTAQEILTNLAEIGTEEDLQEIVGMLETGFTVSGNASVGKYTRWQQGIALQGATVTITGKGIAYLAIQKQSASNSWAGEAYVSVDGATEYRPELSKAIGGLNFVTEFTKSIQFRSISSSYSVGYLVGLIE